MPEEKQHRDRPMKTVTLDQTLVDRIDEMRAETNSTFSDQIERLVLVGLAHKDRNYGSISLTSNQGRMETFWLKEITILLNEINIRGGMKK